MTNAETENPSMTLPVAVMALFKRDLDVELKRHEIYVALVGWDRNAIKRVLGRLVAQRQLLQREERYRLNPATMSEADQALDDWRHGTAPAPGQAEPPPQDGEKEVDRLVIRDVLTMNGVSEGTRAKLAADLLARSDAGLEKYGQRLKTFNGRSAPMDAYQEILDYLNYLRQAMEEELARSGKPYASLLYQDALQLAARHLDYMIARGPESHASVA